MEAPSVLRRWKPFFGAFDKVDAAIEAAETGLCRDEFRRARGRMFELLCDATEDGEAERLCKLLDDVMAEALETLLVVPATATAVASSDLAEAVGALRNHDSERVRRLASAITRAWKAPVQDDLANFRAAKEKLDQQPSSDLGETTILESPAKKKTTTVVCRTAAKIADPPLHKKRAADAGGDRALFLDDEKMATAKRKLHEGYKKVEDAKRQRKIQVVPAPKTKMHPIIKERRQARGMNSTVKRSLTISRRSS